MLQDPGYPYDQRDEGGDAPVLSPAEGNFPDGEAPPLPMVVSWESLDGHEYAVEIRALGVSTFR